MVCMVNCKDVASPNTTAGGKGAEGGLAMNGEDCSMAVGKVTNASDVQYWVNELDTEGMVCKVNGNNTNGSNTTAVQIVQILHLRIQRQRGSIKGRRKGEQLQSGHNELDAEGMVHKVNDKDVVASSCTTVGGNGLERSLWKDGLASHVLEEEVASIGIPESWRNKTISFSNEYIANGVKTKFAHGTHFESLDVLTEQLKGFAWKHLFTVRKTRRNKFICSRSANSKLIKKSTSNKTPKRAGSSLVCNCLFEIKYSNNPKKHKNANISSINPYHNHKCDQAVVKISTKKVEKPPV